MRWHVPVVCLLGGCVEPRLLPAPPQPEGARTALWDLDGSLIATGLGFGAPQFSFDRDDELLVSYFGCAERELEGTPTWANGCRASTAVGFVTRGIELTWSPVDPVEPVEGCDCAELDPYVYDELEYKLVAPMDVRGAAIIEDDDHTKSVLVAASNDGVMTFLLYGRDLSDPDRKRPENRQARTLISNHPEAHSAALWAGDGAIWSVGDTGLFRGRIEGDRLQLEPVETATPTFAGFGAARARIEPESTAPTRLLVVADNGLVLRWSLDRVDVVQAGRPYRHGQIAGHRSDLARLYEPSGGFLMIGPAEPSYDPGLEKFATTDVVVYRDGALSPPIPLPRAVSVASDPNVGAIVIDEFGGLSQIVHDRPEAYSSNGGLSPPEELRIFDGHFVLGRQDSINSHFTDRGRSCFGSPNTVGQTQHLLVSADTLVEVGRGGRVRWSRARSVCTLAPP